MSEDPEVTIEFKGRHDHITERMQAHAAKKLARLARYGDRLARIEVVADHVHRNPEVELIVHQRRGDPLVAKERGTSFSSTIDLLVDKMEAQLRKLKDRRKDHKIPAGKPSRDTGKPARGGAAKTGGRRRSGAAARADEETYEDVVRKSLRP